jgi:hypothetical protein
MLWFIAFLLSIFVIGVVAGYYFGLSVIAEPVEAEEITYCAETAEAPNVELYSLPFQSGSRVLDVTMLMEMDKLCHEYDIPLALALAVAEQESGFNPDVISVTNDYGLMQINKINFGWLRKIGIEPLDHKGNIKAGVHMSSDFVKKYGDYGRALMAYNCGEAGAKRLWKKGVYSTAYSKAVMERFDKWTAYIGGI